MKQAFEFRFPPEPAHLRMLRKTLRDQLVKWKVALDQVDRVLLIVDELVSNAIEHGAMHRKQHEPLSVRATLEGKDLVLVLEDPEVPEAVIGELKHTLQDEPKELPPLDSERGRGLFLIATWLEQIEISALDDRGMRLRGRVRGALA